MIPAHYLSKSDTGYWTVIHGGVPLCADTDLPGALRCAERYNLPVSGKWWDGAVSAWQPASELQAAP
jgi:hypothetical protein